MKNHALPSPSSSPQLGIQEIALWLGVREKIHLASPVTQGE